MSTLWGRVNGAAGIQLDAQDEHRGDRGREEFDVSSAGDGAINLRPVQERARYGAKEIAVRDRADWKSVPERDQSAQLHFPLARIRADGARIFLPAGAGD